MPIQIIFFYDDETSAVLESTTEVVSYSSKFSPGSRQLQITNNVPESPILEPYASRPPVYIDILINGVKVHTTKGRVINTINYYSEFSVVLQALREYIDVTFII